MKQWTHYPDSQSTSGCSFSLILSGEATNTNFTIFASTGPELEPTIYHTRGGNVNHYTIDGPELEPTIYHTRGGHVNNYTTDAVQ